MNAVLKNHFLILQKTLCSKSAGTLLLLLLLFHQSLRVRMTRISFFLPPSFLSFSLTLSIHSFLLSFLLVYPSSNAYSRFTQYFPMLKKSQKRA